MHQQMQPAFRPIIPPGNVWLMMSFLPIRWTLSLARQSLRRGKGVESHSTGTLQDQGFEKPSIFTHRRTGTGCAGYCGDKASPLRMNRLLQGDVGSGKTLVALLALLVAVEAGGQGVMMAPTEILARQHFEGLQPLAKAADVRLDILTGRDKGADRQAKLRDLAKAGSAFWWALMPFSKDVEFRDLRLAVVDEQHRFGVAQRMELGAKGQAADVLVMTATPIPRSLALATYGDMDVSVLDEKPAGRKPIKTALVSDARMDEVIGHLRPGGGRRAAGLLGVPAGRGFRSGGLCQFRGPAFRCCAPPWATARWGWCMARCPRPRKTPPWHGSSRGQTSVLVATTVIEVGCERAQRHDHGYRTGRDFWLGPVASAARPRGRGEAESTCLLMYQPPAFRNRRAAAENHRDTEDGFRIARKIWPCAGQGI